MNLVVPAFLASTASKETEDSQDHRDPSDLPVHPDPLVGTVLRAFLDCLESKEPLEFLVFQDQRVSKETWAARDPKDSQACRVEQAVRAYRAWTACPVPRVQQARRAWPGFRGYGADPAAQDVPVLRA